MEDNGSFTQIFSANVSINEGYLFPQQNLDFNSSADISLYNFFPIPVGCKLISIGFLSENNTKRILQVCKNFSSEPVASLTIDNGLSYGSYNFNNPVEFIKGEFIALRIDIDGEGVSGQNVITAYFEKTNDTTIFNSSVSIPNTPAPLSISMTNLLSELSAVKEKFEALVN